MKIRRSLLKDTVLVELYQGETADGPSRAAPVSLLCNAASTGRLVQGVDGQETVASLVLQLHPDAEGKVSVRSQVTFRGQVMQVLEVMPQTLRGRVVFVQVTCG